MSVDDAASNHQRLPCCLCSWRWQ